MMKSCRRMNCEQCGESIDEQEMVRTGVIVCQICLSSAKVNRPFSKKGVGDNKKLKRLESEVDHPEMVAVLRDFSRVLLNAKMMEGAHCVDRLNMIYCLSMIIKAELKIVESKMLHNPVTSDFKNPSAQGVHEEILFLKDLVGNLERSSLSVSKEFRTFLLEHSIVI